MMLLRFLSQIGFFSLLKYQLNCSFPSVHYLFIISVQHLLSMVDAHSQKERTLETIQDTDGRWCIIQHLLGCCLLAQAQRGLHGKLKDRKLSEAVRCFSRYFILHRLFSWLLLWHAWPLITSFIASPMRCQIHVSKPYFGI